MRGYVLKKQGIYKITNTVNGKVYVGQSTNLHRREQDHFSYLRRDKHFNIRLQRAFNKYGEEAFKFEILELVELKEDLTEREQYWMDTYDCYHSGYNLTPAADSLTGIPKSENTKRLLSEKLSAYWASDDARREQSERKKVYFKNDPNALVKASQVMIKFHTDNPEVRKAQGEKKKVLFSQPERVVEFKERMQRWRATLTDEESSALAIRCLSNRTEESQAKALLKQRAAWLERRIANNTKEVNKTGVSGIFWLEVTSRQGKRLLSACCKWTDDHGKEKSKLYSVNKYGLLEAWSMACIYNKEVVIPLYEQRLLKLKEDYEGSTETNIRFREHE